MSPRPESSFYFSARLRLHYCRWPNPGKPALLLIHGGEDHNRNWDRLVERLYPHFEIVAPDLRGHGESDWVDGSAYNMSGLVLDIANLVEHLAWDQFAMIGHSLGGATVLKYAASFPEKVSRLVAIEGLGPHPALIKELRSKSAPELLREWVSKSKQSSRIPQPEYATLDDAIARMTKKNGHLKPELAEHLCRYASRRLENGHYTWKHDRLLRQQIRFDITPEQTQEFWKAVPCPVLLVRGEDSWASNPAEDGRADHFQNAQVANIPGAGHWVHHDQLDAFMEVVEPFLKQQN